MGVLLTIAALLLLSLFAFLISFLYTKQRRRHPRCDATESTPSQLETDAETALIPPNPPAVVEETEKQKEDVKKRKRKRVRKKRAEIQLEGCEDVGGCRSNEEGKKGEGKTDVLYPFSSHAGVTQRKLKLLYDELVKSNQAEALAMAQMSTSVNKKIIWNERMTETFIKICVQEVRAGNMPTTDFNKKGWTNLQEKFKLLTKYDLDIKQLKNKWDNLKKEWKLWKKLIAKEAGLGWNYAKRTIEASDEWWEKKLKEIPTAVKFRDKGLLLADDMDILFGDVVASGQDAWAPSLGMLPRIDFNDTELEGSGDSEDTLNSSASTDKQSSNQSKGKGKGKREFGGRSSSSKKKQSHDNSVQASLDKLSSIVESVYSKLDHGIEKSIEVLKSLDISKEEPKFFYLCLCLLTKKKDARRILLCLDNPEMQVNYLKTMIYGKD